MLRKRKQHRGEHKNHLAHLTHYVQKGRHKPSSKHLTYYIPKNKPERNADGYIDYTKGFERK